MSNINDKIRQIAKETEPELIHIRRELHQYPELGIDLPKTHEIISRELHKIPGYSSGCFLIYGMPSGLQANSYVRISSPMPLLVAFIKLSFNTQKR